MKLLAALVALTVLAAGCSSGGSGGKSSAASFVPKVQSDASALAEEVSTLVVEAFKVRGTSDLYSLSSDATSVHNDLGDFRTKLFGAADIGNDPQSFYIDAENDVKSGVGTLINWCDDPSPSLTTKWQDQLVKGIPEWNAAVTKIWHDAGLGAGPKIFLPA